MAESISFPWDMFMEANRQKQQNRQNMYQDISGLGQGLGQGIASIGELIGEHKKKAILAQIIAAMGQQGAPQQGPPMAPAGTQQPNMSMIPPGQPMSAGGPNIGRDVQMPQPIPTQTPGQVPASGMGAPGQDNTQLIQKLMMQYDPQGAIKQMMEKNAPLNPLQESERIKNLALADKDRNPPNEWSPVAGQVSKGGKTLFYNKATMEEKEGGLPIKEKSDATDWKHTVEQDKLEKEYSDRVQRVVAARTGGLGLQDQKVDQAIHLRSMVNQSWNPQTKTYELPEMQQGELVMGLANLVSGSQVSNIEQLRSITPKTARGDMAHLVSYWSGKPITNQPQEMIKNLVTSIDRQGQVSEKLRDKYMNGLKSLRPKALDQDRADSIAQAQLTSSFSDVLKESPDQQGNTQAYSDPAKEARYQAWKKANP